MSMKTLADLFHDELRDVLSAEKQLVQALPRMAKKASCSELVAALENHLEETKVHVKRVEKAFEETGKAPRAKSCEAMKGLLEEAAHMLEEKADPDVMDAAIIALAQKVEHYEIATYGALCTWARILGYEKALQELKQIIAEEENCDKALSRIAEGINLAAL